MDFFSNIIKSTINKSETKEEDESKLANDEASPTTAERSEPKKRTNEGEANEVEKPRPRRSSSGETSGPDDNINETIDEDDKTKEAGDTVSHKAIESAKHFGSRRHVCYLLCFMFLHVIARVFRIAPRRHTIKFFSHPCPTSLSPPERFRSCNS